MSNGALVLAGGGVAGIAWELGVLLGIQDVDPALSARITETPTRLVGTSAGAVVASQVAGGVPLQELFDAQLADGIAAVGAQFDPVALGASMANAVEGATSAAEMRRRIGAVALASPTMLAADRRAVLVQWLPVQQWFDRDLRITAVDTQTGELRVFDRASGVPLVDAVGASCAVPGVWPAVDIDGRSYMDGGVRSIANADLAAGADPVLVLAPFGEAWAQTTNVLPPSELTSLAPSRVRVVFADTASVAAAGANPLDPAVRAASSAAGRAQGRSIAAEIAAFWR